MSSAGSPVSLLLYVDDEPALLEIGKIYLEMGTEFLVDTACSAPEALTLLNSTPYDAIISDYQMPGMNGIELLKRVRSVGNQIPFIIFTGKGREEVVIEALNNGADFYLQKNGDPKALYTELVHLTRQSIQMRQMQSTFDEQQQRIHDLQNATDMIQSVGPDGHFFYVNRRWLDILGYQEEDISGLTLFDIIHEESLNHCMELFKRVMAGETVGTIEAIFRRSDGAKVYVEGIVNCKLVDGKPQYTRGLFKDITGRKIAESELRKKNEELQKANEELIATHNELRASEEKFRALVDHSLDGILIIDFSGKLLFVNKAAGSLVDVVDYHGVIGTGNVMEYIAPESQADVLLDFRQVAAGTDSYLANYKLITALKREIWVESVGRRIRFGDSDAILISIRDITKRREADEKLRESEKKFSTLFKNSPVPLTLVSAVDGKFVDVNDAFVRNTGYNRDDVINKTSEDLGLFPDIDQYEHLVSTLRKQRKVGGLEMQCRVKSGGIRSCLFTSGIILMDEKPYLISSVQDITDKKTAEDALAALVRSMVDTTGINALKKITESVRSWLGADCAMVGEIQPDLETVKVLSMVLDGEEVCDFTYTLKGTPCENVREKGFCMYPDDAVELFPTSEDLVHLNVRGYIGTPLRNSEGDVIGIFCVLSRNPLTPTSTIREMMDIIAVKASAEVERIQMDRVIRRSERMLAEAMDLAHLVSWEYDLSTGIFIFNDRFYSLYGTTAEREGGTTMSADQYVREFVHPDDYAVVSEEIQKALQTTDPDYLSEREHRIIRRDGEIRYILVRIGITQDAEGRIIKTHGANQDITERKKAEDAIRQVNKKLNLLTGITRHDINNQLLILNGYVDLLENELSDQSYDRYFREITKASDQITAMIGFTREYEMIGVQAPVWLNQKDLITNAGKGASLGTIRLQNDLPEEIEVFADPLITKVFFNLIDNAIRHGRDLTRIRFSLEEGDDGVFIVCEDDGGGVPIEDKEKIFNRGYGRNTGYGLALSREILDITGITIKETGVFGRGARFEIRAPKGHLRSTPMGY